MDATVIHEKLESLRRCLERIRQRRPESAESLSSDLDAQDIVTVNLTRAVRLCVDIASHVLTETNQPPPDTMGQSFDRLADSNLISESLASRMKAAVGFRNIATHSYREIDWGIVDAIATEHLSDFEHFARAILRQASGQ